MELTFGEQIKIILKRKNMTIRMLAEIIEQQTGKPMSRQNLTQKLNRDNFQEQDMKEIAQALGCVVQISVIDPMEATVASLQSMMQPLPPRRQESVYDFEEPENELAGEETAALPDVSSVLKEQAESALPEENVDSDVLKEIEMALMESIQKELYPSDEKKQGTESDSVNARWQAQAGSQWRRQQQELEFEQLQAENKREDPERLQTEAKTEELDFAVEPETKAEPEYDALSWAQKKPAVWPRLIVPGEEKTAAEEMPAAEYDQEGAKAEPETGEQLEQVYDIHDEPEFVETEDDLDDLEFIEMEELEGGDVSAVSAPYTLKRETVPEKQEEPGEMEDTGGDISYVSAPYIIPREEEPEEEASPSFEIPLEDIPEAFVDDSAETVQEYSTQPEEVDMGEKLASWDAAVKRRLDRPILMPAEERRARRAAREAGDVRERENAENEDYQTNPGVPDINPLTGKEYETNTVKHHPTKQDVLLVYDQDEHRWIEQAEYAFTNFQIRKRAMLGRDYEPPIYLD